jgi:hypothetical protein
MDHSDETDSMLDGYVVVSRTPMGRGLRSCVHFIYRRQCGVNELG